MNESGWFDLCVFLCGFETLNGGFFFLVGLSSHGCLAFTLVAKFI